MFVLSVVEMVLLINICVVAMVLLLVSLLLLFFLTVVVLVCVFTWCGAVDDVGVVVSGSDRLLAVVGETSVLRL